MEEKNIQIFSSDEDDDDRIDYIFENEEKLLTFQNPNFVEKDKFQEEEQSSSIDNILSVKNEVFHEEGIIHLFLDSEYDGDTYICLQCHILFYVKGKLHMKSFLIFNEKYEPFCKKKFGYYQTVKDQEVEIFYEKFDEINTPLINVLGKVLSQKNFFLLYEKRKVRVMLSFYFSWKDLRAAFGFENLRNMVASPKEDKKKGIIYQRKNLKGWFKILDPINRNLVFEYNFTLRDLYGWNGFGLQTLVESLGLAKDFSAEKSSMNDFKENMIEGLLKKPFEFFYYAMNDVFALQACVKFQIFSCNTILKDVYKVEDPSYLFTVKNIRFSLGTLVKKFFTVFSQSVLFKSNKLSF
jgi:hypothetical protein